MITLKQYLKNQEKCEICGCNLFFSTSKYGITEKLECKECDAVYIRNLENETFEINK